jgi:hypothetical protein
METLSTYQQMLQGRPRGLSEPEVTHLFTEVLRQLVPLHDRRQCHGNLTLDSISQTASGGVLLANPEPKPFAEPQSDLHSLARLGVALLSNRPFSPDWEQYCTISDQLTQILNYTLNSRGATGFQTARHMLGAIAPQVLNSLPSAPSQPPGALSQTLNLAQATAQLSIKQVRIAQQAIATQLANQNQTGGASGEAQSGNANQWPSRQVGMAIGGGLVLLSIGAGIWLNRPNPASNASEPAPSAAPPSGSGERVPEPAPPRINPFASVSFPQVSCGDPKPTSLENYPVSFYPIFVADSDATLSQARMFCRDALRVKRKDTGRYGVQVSSFTSYEKAKDFKDHIATSLLSSEIGPPTVLQNPNDSGETSSSAARPGTGSDASSPKQVTTPRASQTETESIAFAKGTSGTNLSGSVSNDLSRRYTLECGAGQLMEIRPIRGIIRVSVVSPSGNLLKTIQGAGTVSLRLPEKGTYTLTVDNNNDPGGSPSTSYNVRVDVY